MPTFDENNTCYSALTICLLLGVGTVVLACTGFAVYGDQIYYGMNFDFDLDHEIRFSIESRDDQSIFLGSFRLGDQWASMVGYNNRGLFATMQMVPERVPENVSTIPMIIPDLKARALHAETIQEVEEMIERPSSVSNPRTVLLTQPHCGSFWQCYRSRTRS